MLLYLAYYLTCIHTHLPSLLIFTYKCILQFKFQILSGGNYNITLYDNDQCTSTSSKRKPKAFKSQTCATDSSGVITYTSTCATGSPPTLTSSCVNSLVVPLGYTAQSDATYVTSKFYTDSGCTDANLAYATSTRTATCVPSDVKPLGGSMKYIAGKPNTGSSPYTVRAVYYNDASCNTPTLFMNFPRAVYTTCAATYTGTMRGTLGTYSASVPSFPSGGAVQR